MRWGEIRKILTFVKLEIASKIPGKIILRPLKFRKTQVAPGRRNKYKFYGVA